MHLNVKQFALASGVMGGLVLLLTTVIATGRGVGNNLSHLSVVFPGYQVTYLGSLIGAIYGFVGGLVGGAVFSAIYNGTGKREARP